MKKENSKIVKRGSTAGYTIIETMIAVSLFLSVVVSGMGALLNANSLHQKSSSMRSIMDNLSFILEDMSRNLRTGYGYHCFTTGQSLPTSASETMSDPNSCASGWAIAFEAAGGQASDDGVSDTKDNDQWVYYIENGKIYKSVAGPYAASAFVQLTPDEVTINSISGFAVLGAETRSAGNTQQPMVTIRLVGQITLKNVVTNFSLQTSTSQRLIDL